MKKFIVPCLLFFCGIGAIFLPIQGAKISAATAARSLLLVANQDDHDLSIIDPEAGRQIATVPESGITGHEVAASPDGRTAYVPIYGDSGVGKPGSDGRYMDVVDIARRKVIGKIDFGHGVRPHLPVYDPVSGMLYVTTELDKAVAIVDPRTLKVIGSVPTGQAESHMLAISHDGRRGYTANVGPGTMSVLDLAARKTVAIVPIAGQVQRISISNDDRMVFTSDQTKPRLAVIDTSTNKITKWVPLPGTGYGSASTKDGRWLLVAIPSLDKVAVIDRGTLKVVRTIDVPKHPSAILVRPDGLVAYVSCGESHEVAAIDLAQWKVQALIEAGKYADGMAWAP